MREWIKNWVRRFTGIELLIHYVNENNHQLGWLFSSFPENTKQRLEEAVVTALREEVKTNPRVSGVDGLANSLEKIFSKQTDLSRRFSHVEQHLAAQGARDVRNAYNEGLADGRKEGHDKATLEAEEERMNLITILRDMAAGNYWAIEGASDTFDDLMGELQNYEEKKYGKGVK